MVHKGSGWHRQGTLDFCVCRKDTSIWMPLAASSGHSPGCHVSWPTGVIKRHMTLCSAKKDAVQAGRVFMNAIRQRCFHHPCFMQNSGTEILPAAKRKVCLRIILPFHKVWQDARIQKEIDKCLEKWRSVVGISIHASTGLSWKLGSQHLVSKLLKCNAWEHSDTEAHSLWLVGGD